jgi:methylmalonyl-CoA/ethylmalonyl-CoA epimerase
MDRRVISDLHSMLAPEGAGGVLEPSEGPDVATLAATANEYGARFVELAGPSTKGELLDALRTALDLPEGAGHNWDSLEEVLRYPWDPAGAKPAIVVWHDASRLPTADAAVFRDIVHSAAEARAGQGVGAIIVAVDPPRASQEAPMPSVPAPLRSLGKVHHVALIVASIEDGLRLWRDTLGAPLEQVMDIEHDRVRIAFLTVGESKVELVQPTDETTGVARFLALKGEGFHHVCFEVEDLAATLDRLAAEGLELIDTAPRRGADGPVAFIHPRSGHGVLVELIEAPGGPAWAALGMDPPQHSGEPQGDHP